MTGKQDKKYLIVLVGPTGVGKTRVAITLAKHFDAPVLSADSRQVYRELKIGTAAPTPEEQAQAHHVFVGHRSIHGTYNAYEFAQDAHRFLQGHFQSHPVAIMAGGAGLYIDAVLKGIDDLPTISDEIREQIKNEWQVHGLQWLREEVERADPAYFAGADVQNPMRLRKALEIFRQTGKPYSEFRVKKKQKLDFEFVKIGLNLPRPVLYERINSRVLAMMEQGLENEAFDYDKYRQYSALNTVGYKEFFPYFDGKYSLQRAIELVQRNSRRYAKRQLTWFRKDEDTYWLHPQHRDVLISLLNNKLDL